MKKQRPLGIIFDIEGEEYHFTERQIKIYRTRYRNGRKINKPKWFINYLKSTKANTA